MSLQQEILDDFWGIGGGEGCRTLSFSGKMGTFKLSKGEEDAPLTERKRFEGVLLYMPRDPGRALWPDGKLFTGDKVLCQSDRSMAPYDNARVGSQTGVERGILNKMGWTGRCSNCQVPESVCKRQLIAYVLDLAHLAEITAFNAANPDEEPLQPTFTKLNAKGPQNYWNAMAGIKELAKQARKDKAEPTSFVLRFGSEAGLQGSKKMKIEVVGAVDENTHALANVLAAEAYTHATQINASTLSLPAPSSSANAEFIDNDEIPF